MQKTRCFDHVLASRYRIDLMTRTCLNSRVFNVSIIFLVLELLVQYTFAMDLATNDGLLGLKQGRYGLERRGRPVVHIDNHT